MLLSRIAGALVVVLALAASMAARAQDRSGWVVAVATSGADSAAARRAAGRATEHLSASGQAVVSGPELDERVASAISAPFVPLTEIETERLRNATDSARNQVQYGDDEGTERTAAPVLRDFGQRLAAVGRDEAAARLLGDLCLFVVRAQLHARRADAARSQVAECARLVPGLTPASDTHPGQVRQMFDAARSDQRSNGSPLTLDVSDAAASCVLRLNGHRMDRSAAVRLAPGRHDVQLECGSAPGRVHAVELGGGGGRVVIVAGLDEALGDRSGVSLTYASQAALAAQLPAHVGSVGRALGVANVLVVRTDSADALALERYRIDDGGARRAASARVALSADERVPPAVDALVAERSVDIDDADAARSSGGSGDSRRLTLTDPSDQDDGGSLLGPLVLGGAGLAALGVVIGTWATLGCVESYDTGRCAAEEQLDAPLAITVASVGLAAIGGAILWLILD